MWIFLNDAFVSIVADRNDRTRFLVRGRLPGDIECLWPEAEVLEGQGSDYRFRAYLPRASVVKAITNRLRDVDYGNFKGSVRQSRRHDAYFEVWDAMFRAQEAAYDTRPYPEPFDDDAVL